VSIETVIDRARRRQAVQLTQRATIVRPTGPPTFDSETRESVQPVTTLHTDLPCKVTNNDRAGLDVAVGETEIRVTDREIKFPVGTVVAEGDLVTITAGTYNTVDIGVTYRITDIDRREWQVARRCVIEEVAVPRLWEVED
jgi:hypothetical protein